MVQLSRQEREDLLELARSEQMKHDSRRMKANRDRYLKETGTISFDSYIAFATASNAFANHSMKPLRKIKGDHFKL